MILASAFAGFWTAPPKPPEWRSTGEPTMSICVYSIPRSDVVIAGTLPSKKPVSLITTASACMRSLFASSQRGRFALVDSSSPSKT